MVVLASMISRMTLIADDVGSSPRLDLLGGQ
jgi:hypothetical protein